MPKFKKKPVVIEAIQLNGNNLKEIETFVMGKEMPELYVGDDKFSLNWGNGTIQIHTLEGIMQASKGDWIIKGIQGEFYPCKPDIFEKTYDKVEEK